MDEAAALDAVRRALLEDRAGEDATTRLLGATTARTARARFRAEGRCVAAGVPVVALVFRELDPSAVTEAGAAEGAWVEPGDVLVTVRAMAAALLSGERVALNFLQRLCSIATLTRRAVEAVAGTPARITHTRKTTPGLRALERYAVLAGGGVPNRGSLAEAVMWKDNHWALLAAWGGSLADALRGVPTALPVIVEVETDQQLYDALAAGASHLLVDNQSPERVAVWARRVGPGVTLQASGGIGVENARAYADAGATLISIGALTHSAPAAPIGCEMALEEC